MCSPNKIAGVSPKRPGEFSSGISLLCRWFPLGTLSLSRHIKLVKRSGQSQLKSAVCLNWSHGHDAFEQRFNSRIGPPQYPWLFFQRVVCFPAPSAQPAMKFFELGTRFLVRSRQDRRSYEKRRVNQNWGPRGKKKEIVLFWKFWRKAGRVTLVLHHRINGKNWLV